MVAEHPAENIARAVNQTISHRVRAQVRTLYLIEGHNPKTIESLGVGLTAKQIYNLVHSEGWSQQRREANLRVREITTARANAAVEQLAEAIAIEGEELCFKALDVTRQGLNAGGVEGAKQAQAASSTLRNIHSVVQAIRKPVAAMETSNVNLNVFFTPPNAAKEVTEIEAKRVS